jgi:hypothetical protein
MKGKNKNPDYKDSSIEVKYKSIKEISKHYNEFKTGYWMGKLHLILLINDCLV